MPEKMGWPFMKRMQLVLAFVYLYFALPFAARPHEPANKTPVESLPTKTRPKIGVALEGGGALGLAHIGVLQWFEDHHIPVDYVAGTSMGGLVGGFYATGKSPEELKQL